MEKRDYEDLERLLGAFLQDNPDSETDVKIAVDMIRSACREFLDTWE